MREAVGPVRCAVYTRKSTEDGLDQEFNSLDAQREACAANITSRRHEGWTPLPDRYDDGGFSGGSMERPAFKRLLAEVAAGRVDVIVIYKVDRLTRSLADFSRIVDVLDRAKASFVSITQAFNTITSMGRLTLNMLLSFAQFEREVTGERIRDKIAASKRKGLWMGTPVPLGYAVQDRRLVVVDPEAELVRHIMRRYLALGSARFASWWRSSRGRGTGLSGKPTPVARTGAGSRSRGVRCFICSAIAFTSASPGRVTARTDPPGECRLRLDRSVDLHDPDAIAASVDAVTACEIKSTNQSKLGPDLRGYFFHVTAAELLTAQSLGERYRFVFVNTITGRHQELSLSEIGALARIVPGLAHSVLIYAPASVRYGPS